MRQEEILKTIDLHRMDHYDFESLALRKSLYIRVFEEHASDPQPIKYAKALWAFLEEKPIILQTYDILAGLIQHYDVSASMPVNYPENYDPRVLPIYTRSTDVKQIVEACALLMEENDTSVAKMYDLEKAAEIGLFAHNPYGHVIPGFIFLVKNGIDFIIEKIEKKSREQGLRPEQSDYLAAMKIAVSAVSMYMKRYAEQAKAMSDGADEEQQRSNLLRIWDSCTRLAHKPAEHFFDAVQFVTILQELVTIETASGSMSLGRLDQLFYPYYERDVAAGIVNEEEAQCIIDAWRMKLSGLLQGFQNLTICGCDDQGRFAGNEISKMILRSSRKYRYDQPLLSMRYTSDTPRDFWEETLSLIELGDGFPAMFNDDVIIPSRVRAGIAKEDAWNYGIVGCVEPSIQGKEFSNTEEMRINWLKILELMLHGGTCTFTGIHVPLQDPKNLDDIRSYEEFLDWFKKELIHYTVMAAEGCKVVERAYYKRYPVPLLSATMDGCIDNACDASSETGPVYRLSTINNCGMSNVVDSLLAIKEIVFEKKYVTLSELCQILDQDFEGHEELRQYAKNKCSKFGNASDDATELMKELIELSALGIEKIRNHRGYAFQAGMYSVDQHASFGMQTFASPDGRKRGTSLANGLSPVQGADQQGPTAVINAITAFDHTAFGNGMVLDLKFTPSMFKNPKHREMLFAMLKTYFAKGGMEMQFNVVSKETLIDAQKNPAQYQNLIVRVSGFSAYFVNLFKVLQDEIIERTENDTI